MNSNHAIENTLTSPKKKPGRNLLCEILIFFIVFAVCSLGNLLIVIALLECFFIPLFGGLADAGASSNPMEVVNSVLALPHFSIMMLFGTAATILVAILFCKIIQKRSWKSIGLSRQNAFSNYICGAIFGAITISLIVAICAVTGAGFFTNEETSSVLIIALFLLAYLIQGASEEILCRGYFMYSVARRYPMWVAVMISSIMFALLHMPNNGISLIALLNLFLFGVFAAVVTIRTGSIWYASGFHSAWNFVQGNFYGIKVSGMDMHGSLLHFTFEPSKAYLNGGAFGIEGGLLCTAFLIIGILFFLRQIQKDTSKVCS